MTTNIDRAADIIAAPLRPLVKGYAATLMLATQVAAPATTLPGGW